MRLMEKKSSILILAFILGFASFSCSSDDDDNEIIVVVNKTELASKINEAQTLLDSTEEGTAEGQYERGSQKDLKEVVDLAQVVYDDSESAQIAVDNTVLSLVAATDEYMTKVIVPIAPEDLVGHWTFDDGTGSVLTDFSGNGFNGLLKDGSETWGGSLPTWTTDRYGNEGKALNFDLGAHVNIPYNTAINPSQMSISVWVKADESLESNRFMGLHSWNGFKFQLQAANKPFFTAATSDGIFDKDTDPALDLDVWYHLVVTAGNGEMVFYVNGTETQRWDDVAGTMAQVTGHDLVFGQGSSQYAATTENYDNDKIIPLDWGGYFHGSLDEVRIYKSILSSSQVTSIYETEKVEE